MGGNAGAAGSSAGAGGRGGGGGTGGGSGAGGVGGTGIAVIQRVSVTSDGVEANSHSEDPSLSGDGQLVAFHSYGTNLVAGDTNGVGDVFVHDLRTGQTVRVSVDSAGAQANGASMNASLSANGRFVAFESDATNLVAGDTNAYTDVFVRDLQTGTTRRASVDSTGAQGNSASTQPSISADGRFVAFTSYASNLAGVGLNAVMDVFVHDFQTGTTVLASVGTAGNESLNQNSLAPTISGDGRLVAFHSYANDLVGDLNNTFANIYVRDLQAGTLQRVTADTAGNHVNGDCYTPALSGDGRLVGFMSAASNLVSGDTNNRVDTFVRNIPAGTTVLASADSSGVASDADSSGRPSLSTTGRLVAFFSRGTNLVSGGDGITNQVFVRDLQAGKTACASVTSAGALANADAFNVSLSADGRFVAFESMATNLVPGGTAAQFDVFVAPVP